MRLTILLQTNKWKKLPLKPALYLVKNSMSSDVLKIVYRGVFLRICSPFFKQKTSKIEVTKAKLHERISDPTRFELSIPPLTIEVQIYSSCFFFFARERTSLGTTCVYTIADMKNSSS